MIHDAVVGRLRDGVPQPAAEPGPAAVAALDPPGLVTCHVGTDRRLRERSRDVAITSEVVDAEHHRIRRELVDPYCEQIARVQFAI